MKKLVVSLLLVNLLAACGSQKALEKTDAATQAPVATSNAGATSAAKGTNVSGSALNNAANNAATNNASANTMANASVYYPLDVDAVAAGDKAMLQTHAKYLSEHANSKVELVGNADERGSNEYNLALGQRRADGVKKLLELGGAKAAQLKSVSYGEEKPKAAGHNEAAWSQNRRTDINYVK